MTTNKRQDDFWTEELVYEFMSDKGKYMTQPDIIKIAMDNFKASKQKEIVQPNWEIVSCQRDSMGVHGFTKDCIRCSPPCKIFSVKRLSDGEIFSIGDEVSVASSNYKIKSFEVGRFNLFVHAGMSYPLSFGSIKKISTPAISTTFQWDDTKAKEFCEYAGLRIGKKEDIRSQLSYLIEDFKTLKSAVP